MNSAWGLGLDNLYYVVDWNDFGIDDMAASSVVYGTPKDWFGAHGWRVVGTEQGSEWEPVARTSCELAEGENARHVPSMAWVKTRKGRGYPVYDNKSHGVPHAMNSELFWKLRAGSPGSTAPVRRRGATDAKGPGRPAGAVHSEPQSRRRRARRGHRACRLPRRPAGRARRERSDEHIVFQARHDEGPLAGQAPVRLRRVSGRALRGAGREGREPGGAREVGRLGERLRARALRAAAVPGLIGRPRRLDEHRGLRREAGDTPGWGALQPRQQPGRRAPPRRSPSSRTPASRSASRR